MTYELKQLIDKLKNNRNNNHMISLIMKIKY